MSFHRKLSKLFRNPKRFFADAHKKSLVKRGGHIQVSVESVSAPMAGDVPDLETAFQTLLADQTIKIVSFDVFDTLITRPLEEPHDIFQFLALEAQKEFGINLERLVWARIAANIRARQKKAPGEMTYEEVYGLVKKLYNLTDDQTEKLSKLEMEIEKKLSLVRPFGRKLWDIAFASGKPIVCISDMYMTEDAVKALLTQAGYEPDIYTLFVSSACNCFKSSGLLYDYVLKKLQCAPEEILYVGDHHSVDIDIPRKKGMKALHVPSARARILDNQYYKRIFPTIPYFSGATRVVEPIVSGLIAQRLFDTPVTDDRQNSLFLGSHFNLGYAALGPIVLAYLLWLGRDAASRQIEHLFFLSREGWLFKGAYETLFEGDKNAISSSYLYTSTRAARMASLKTSTDISNLAIQLYKDGVAVKDLLKGRFGLDAADIPQAALQAVGYANLDQSMRIGDSDCRYQFIDFCSTIADQILAHAEKERRAYLQYLHTQEVTSHGRTAVVDIGWSGNSVAYLQPFFERPMTVYFYNATQTATSKLISAGGRLDIKVFSGHYCVSPGIFAVTGFSAVTEFLVCCSEASLVSFEELEASVKPIFRHESAQDHARRKKIVDETHRGVMAFIKDVKNHFNDFLHLVHIDPFFAERVYASFLRTPSYHDAMLLYGACYENIYAGFQPSYIVSPDKGRPSLWREGHKAVHGWTLRMK